MPKIFTTLDKIKPAYDITYKVVLFICKLLLIADIIITTMSVIGRYVPFIPDPAGLMYDFRTRGLLYKLSLSCPAAADTAPPGQRCSR